MLRRVVTFSVVLTAAASVAACGSNQSQPDAPSSSAAGTTTTTTKAPPPIVAPAQLQPGKYPTEPRPAPGEAGDATAGAIVDAHRLAGYVVGPWQVDSTLLQPITALTPYLVLDQAQALGQLGPESIAEAAGRHKFINGFSSTRQSTDKRVLVNAVLQFATADEANQAAAEMNNAATSTPIKGGTPKPVAINGHSEALASAYEVESGGQRRTSIRSFTPSGPLVLMQLAQGPAGSDQIGETVTKAIDAQLTKLKGFKPVDPAALAAIPVDPSGLLAKTLFADSAATTKNAVYTPEAALHFQMDPSASAKTFQDNGVTDIAMGLTNVFQTKDPWAAVDVVDTFAKESGADANPADAVPGLSLSKCASVSDGKQFYCVAPAGNYAIEAHAANLQDVHEQVAAQYILLTAGKS